MPKNFDFLSPGVLLTEVDQSILPAQVDADGPIIIGRFRKGPGMQPVKVRSLDDFVQVFGAPVPGGSSLQGDVWRDGANLSAPTYGAYAAQAWLASETSPVTVVRLMGDQTSKTKTAGGFAGWQLTNSQPKENAADNSTAYGLFIVDAEKNAKLTFRTIDSKLAGLAEDRNFTITDPLGVTVTFQYDSNASLIETATLQRVDTSATPGTNAALAALQVAAIEAAIQSGKLNHIVVAYDGSNTFELAATTTGGSPAVADDGNNSITGEGSLSAPTQVLGNPGALAAVIYCDSGYLSLFGTKPGSSAGAAEFSGSNALIESSATNEFTIGIHNSAGNRIEKITFNFSQNSGKYIRNKLSTTPYKTNSNVMKDASDVKSYWLGETFDRFLADKVTSTGAGNQLAALIPLHKGDDTAAKSNWGYHRAGSAYAKSGYFIDYHKGGNDDYDAVSAEKLFRVCSLHSGEQIQKEIMITIEDLKTPSNPVVYNFGTFTLKVISVSGQVLETYSNLTLDKNSVNYISRRIGDRYQVWSDDNNRYSNRGDFENNSNYIRVELYDATKELKGKLPVGFLGPGRPKGFGVVAGDNSFKSITATGIAGDFSGVFATGSMATPFGASGSVPLDMNTADSNIDAVKFLFPSIPLRKSGSEGFSNNPYKAMWGIRPTLTADSTLYDPGYCDYVRALPSTYAAQQFSPSGDFEHSFAFSLDDIRIDEGVVTYESGSHKAGLSYTAVSGTIQPLFDLGVKQFAAPLFGGFDGLDIKQVEPFANDQILDSLNLGGDYRQYSIHKAIDSVSDSEIVPANLLIAPGFTKAVITNKVMSLANTRKDMLAIIDLPGDYVSSYESTNSEETRIGSVASAVSNLKDKQIDSSYVACYYPSIQVQDNLNSSERVWLPSSIAGFGAIAQSERNSELWFAPAGFNRGGLGNLGGPSGPAVIQARQRLDSGDRDKLYEVNINPIATFPNEGVVIFGQKTLQQTPSALDRINVRRLMIFIKSEVGKVARNLLFEPNVQATFNRFIGQVNPILTDIQNKFGLTEFRIVLDETTTTADLVDRNIMYAKIFLKPARAIEFIAVDFVITKSGAEFT